MDELQGKTAIITGASAPKGIGRATALKLSQLGANVVITDLTQLVKIDGIEYARMDLLGEVCAEIEKGGGHALALPLDVTKPSDISSCIEKAISVFGGVDILVNNAGSPVGADNFLSTTPDQWETSFRVNLLGPMMMAQAVIPEMKKRGGGRIINIGSIRSLGVEPGFGAYTAMKHGLVGLSKTLAAEFGVDGILCNTICPGYIATDLHLAANQRLAAENGLSLDDIKSKRYANVALRDAGLPSDVANAVAYLAGPQSNYTTGINLPVTGGVPTGV